MILHMHGGKSHVIQTIGVVEKGIMIVFVPLLALSVNVMEKFWSVNEHLGTVYVQHFDKLYGNNRETYDAVLKHYHDMKHTTTSLNHLWDVAFFEPLMGR